MKNYFKNILNGIYSIAKGMSTFCIYSVNHPDFMEFKRGFKEDRDAMKSDWKAVGDDLRKAMKEVSLEKRV